MKKFSIAFGILFSVLSVSAKTTADPMNDKKVVKETTKNLTPLNLAVAKGNYVLTEQFLAYGSDINEGSKVMGMTPLMYAARYNNVKLLKLLIANGAEVELTSKVGVTALEYAKISKASEAVTYLSSL
ncbi:ankyrin repeat domain-containing protein [Cellulophaga sp. F20128]|uniref:ankyrin repeat domain-containing protein n=1 Tax=Cellulophaga sp. F20128 TaxID=2926413 RepID=UPI001FF6FB10|nr:ankyrin repeat domain-containing protein [Cellulophaga sp. F20128]MCK0158697.1 ankyrin repeat domain-containing protein [Cellulophaga sp. F20128]